MGAAEELEPPAFPSDCDVEGWKEIATLIGVSVDTAQEYERDRGLPVWRWHGRIYARTVELRRWGRRRMRRSSSS